MAVYNSELFLKDAIKSILDQTFKEFELIIINDGSTDKSLELINSFNDERIVLINQENQGAPCARNNGIKISRGEYIAILDSDDIAFPDRLQKQIEFLEKNPDYILVGSNAEVIDADGNYVYSSDQKTSWDEVKRQLPATPFIHSTVMFRKSVIRKERTYLNIPPSEDGFLYNDLAKRGQMTNMEECLIQYRLSPFALSRKSRAENKLMDGILKDFLITGRINTELKRQLNEVKRNLSEHENLYQYHILLAKKYLWNNYNARLARKNIYLAFRYKKIDPLLFFLYMISFLPPKSIQNIYSIFQRNINI